MTDKADITIIGAGVFGLAIAAEVAREGRQVYVLEKDDTFGKHQSSRSAEVIHAGLYHAADSLKTQLCLEGHRRLYELCHEHAIVHTRCGKIMMATNPAEEVQLAKLFQQGQTKGAPVQMLSPQEMHRIEPNLVATSAFLSPSTGTVDSYGLMEFFLARRRIEEPIWLAEQRPSLSRRSLTDTKSVSKATPTTLSSHVS